MSDERHPMETAPRDGTRIETNAGAIIPYLTLYARSSTVPSDRPVSCCASRYFSSHQFCRGHYLAGSAPSGAVNGFWPTKDDDFVLGKVARRKPSSLWRAFRLHTGLGKDGCDSAPFEPIH